MRVVERDHQTFFYRVDPRTSRINVTVKNGIVVRAEAD